MTQAMRTGMKELKSLSPEGCPGCKHLRSFTGGEHFCSLYMDYPQEDDLKLGCIYRLPITEKYYRKKK
jgi:hypothetical protein